MNPFLGIFIGFIGFVCIAYSLVYGSEALVKFIRKRRWEREEEREKKLEEQETPEERAVRLEKERKEKEAWREQRMKECVAMAEEDIDDLFWKNGNLKYITMFVPAFNMPYLTDRLNGNGWSIKYIDRSKQHESLYGFYTCYGVILEKRRGDERF